MNVAELINEVLSAFGHSKSLFTDPMFLVRLVEAGAEVMAAGDDESRRAAIQRELLRLQAEFGGQAA